MCCDPLFPCVPVTQQLMPVYKLANHQLTIYVSFVLQIIIALQNLSF